MTDATSPIMLSEQTHCPICAAPADFREYLKHLGHRWVRCVRCGGGHKTPYVPETDDAEYTKEHYDKVYLEPAFFERRRKFALNQAGWIAKSFRPDMAVVEIGPGLGLVAERFLEMFPGTPYHVVEPHHWFAHCVSKRLGKRVFLHEQKAVDAHPSYTGSKRRTATVLALHGQCA